MFGRREDNYVKATYKTQEAIETGYEGGLRLDKNPYSDLEYIIDYPLCKNPKFVEFDSEHLNAMKTQATPEAKEACSRFMNDAKIADAKVEDVSAWKYIIDKVREAGLAMDEADK